MASMPPCSHWTAPKFNPNQPWELRRYFSELDLLFDTCNITNSDIKKQQACQYLDIDSADLWESIPQFGTSTSYKDFRNTIYKFYPSSDDEHRWSVADMETLIFEQLHRGVFDLNDLGSYHQSFFTITHYLCLKNCISDAEQSKAFLRGFQSSVLARIEHRLELKFPDHYPDDPYPLTDVHNAAKFVLAGTNTSSIGISHSTSPPNSISTTPKSLYSPT
jgi:hypothetical protein